jgi:peptidyl-prolyl cis-trans isomerase C
MSTLSASEKDIFLEHLTAIRISQDNWLKRLSKDKDIQKEICRFLYLKNEITNKIKISDSDCRTYYNQNYRRFQHPEYAFVSIIRLTYNKRKKGDKEAVLQKMKSIHAQLIKQPKSFADFARKYSDCSSKNDGGKLGMILRHMFSKNIDNVLFSMRNNTISQPLETNNAFFIIKCESRHGARTLSFNEVKGEIAEFLQQEKAQSKIDEFFKNLRKKNKVHIFIKMPPFKQIKMEIPEDAKFN